MNSDLPTGVGEEICLAFCADDAYALPLAVTLHSSLSTLGSAGRAKIVLVDGGISETSRQRLERVISLASPTAIVAWHEIDTDRLTGVRISDWGSRSNYLRLFLPEILSDTTRRVLYLDSDLLVRSSLFDLWNLGSDRQNLPVLAARDCRDKTVGQAFSDGAVTALGLDPDAGYFNSGVMVLNLERWKSTGLTASTLEIARTQHMYLRLSDQDALNAALNGGWEQFGAEWNRLLCCADGNIEGHATKSSRKARRDQLIAESHVLHFCGPYKPWRPGYTGPCGREFRRTLHQSGWFDSDGEHAVWLARYWINPGWMRPVKIWMARTFPRAFSSFKNRKTLRNPPPTG